MQWLKHIIHKMTKEENKQEGKAILSEHQQLLSDMNDVAEGLHEINRRISVGELIYKSTGHR